ncbi:MAG TPA: choline/carnitine O-acyltransferase [Blastocatellia bacterium]|nr:choline/carnitine O-acyltransferase [Blastocatellia bacterium]
METTERTRDIFERIAAYPQPPLIPLPEPGDLESLKEAGINTDSRLARLILQTTAAVTGFSAFQKQLPERLEEILRRTDVRGANLFAPVIVATLALTDDPRHPTQLQRAATLILGARSLYADLISGRLPPDQHRGQPLEMGQYPNFFSTSLIVENRKARLFKSAATSHITVIARGRFFSLKVWDQGRAVSVAQLTRALAGIQQLTRAAPPGKHGPGLLTSAQHPAQVRIFTQLEQHPVNRESLLALRHSFLTLCLDSDTAPASAAEAARFAQSANQSNRWHHSSLQLVVFGNARACVLCNFNAWLDGNTMMRGAAEIQRRAIALPLENAAEQSGDELAQPVELRWQINPAFFAQAQRDLQSVHVEEQATFEISGIGRSFFTAHQTPAVPAFVAALALAARRLGGAPGKVTQFLTLTKYRCMDVTRVMVTTPEVERFVEAADRGRAGHAEARPLLYAAIRSQEEKCRRARQKLSIQHLRVLFIQSRNTPLRRLGAMLGTILMRRLLALFGLSDADETEILISHPEIYPEVPVVGRPGIRLPYVSQFGLHYQILEDRIVITLMPGVKCRVSNQQFIAELEGSLKEIQALISGTDQAAPAIAQTSDHPV